MSRNKNTASNPFDSLYALMEGEASYEDNLKRIRGLLGEGEVDLDLVAELLMQSGMIPLIAGENAKLREVVADLTDKLNKSTDIINDYNKRFKELAIDSQEGITVEEERHAMKFLKFPKGLKVN